MIHLIFDTETTGFVQRNLPLSAPSQPHLLQLAMISAKGEEVLLEEEILVLCPIPVPEDAAAVHGITNEALLGRGISLIHAVRLFDSRVREADCLVSHNMAFDAAIMEIAYRRVGVSTERFLATPRICTTLAAARHFHSRWPKLDKAYRLLVDPEGFIGAHDALADARAAFKVLLALERRGADLMMTSE